MIFELILSPLFLLIKGIVSLLPVAYVLPDWTLSLVSLIRKGLLFFPSDVWVAVIGNILFWIGVQFVWAIVEWVYKKVPRCKLKFFETFIFLATIKIVKKLRRQKNVNEKNI